MKLKTIIISMCAVASLHAAERPNIVLIMLDDMGYSDLGCYGGEIETPHIDKLAENGVRFSQFYNSGRCCPTRASMLTGLYPHRAGVGHMASRDYGFKGYKGEIRPEAATIAESLKAAGYDTWMAGKWHLSINWSPEGSKHNWPLQRGFDKFYGTLIAAGSQWNPITLTEGNKSVFPVSKIMIQKYDQWAENNWITDWAEVSAVLNGKQAGTVVLPDKDNPLRRTQEEVDASVELINKARIKRKLPLMKDLSK